LPTANISPNRFEKLWPYGQAIDRVRNQRMPVTGPTLDYLGLFTYAIDAPGILVTDPLSQCRRGVHIRKLDCMSTCTFAKR
jgi:hypothetical protein